MRVLLVSASGRISSDGSRLISALLKRAGHSVYCVYLNRKTPYPVRYETKELEKLHDLLKNTDLVLLAVYSSFAIRAVQVSEFVHTHYPDIKVMWGGPHCISAPEMNLKYADGVCYSEGDQVVIDLVNRIESGQDYLDLPNMAFEVNGAVVKNDVLPPFTDLDSLPYPDFDLDSLFVLDGDLHQLTKEKAKSYSYIFPFAAYTFHTITSRGCPHLCSYCNNCRYVAMWGKNSIRHRGIDHIIGELKHSLDTLDFFSHVGFGDDDFLVRPKEQLEEFAVKYRRDINLPFTVTTSANAYRKDKFEILLEGGLKHVQIGVQSGSQRILDEVFNRKVTVQKTKTVAREIVSFQESSDLMLALDFIIDNPYETDEDIIETYKYFLDLPLGIRINIYQLAFYPGTPLYERAIGDGIVDPFSMESPRYQREILYKNNYSNFLLLIMIKLYLEGFVKYIPKFVFLALTARPMRRMASIFPERAYSYLIKKIRKRIFVTRPTQD